MAESDNLSVEGIKRFLLPQLEALKIEVRDEVTSTNTVLRERAAEGAPGGEVLIAASQSAGRGRLGRSFFSPLNSGLYMSILLRPENCPPTRAADFTTMAAVAMSEAIEEVSGRSAGIKWVNDIFVDGKKVCGILTESGINRESGLIDFVVLGVGVNVCAPDGGFPDELGQIAASLFDSPQADARNRLAAGFLNHFIPCTTGGERSRYVEEYRRRSLAIGRKISVIRKGEAIPAQALDIDDDCHLLVRYDDGTSEYLSSGEISIRL